MVEKMESVLHADLKKLEIEFKGKEAFTVEDVRRLFPDTNPKTINWKLYRMVQNGSLYRPARGNYSFQVPRERSQANYEYLSNKAKKIYGILQNYGYKSYLSGLDGLTGDLQHVPESFPVLVVVAAEGMREIQQALIHQGLTAYSMLDHPHDPERFFVNSFDAILIKGKDFSWENQGIAVKEKAFVDLYYVMTRMEYDFPIEELSRVYDTLLREKEVTRMRLSDAANDLSVRTEIDFLLGIPRLSRIARSFFTKRIEKGQRNGEKYGSFD